MLHKHLKTILFGRDNKLFQINNNKEERCYFCGERTDKCCPTHIGLTRD